MNSSVASHVSEEVCQFWKRDFGDPVTKASKAVTGGPFVAGGQAHIQQSHKLCPLNHHHNMTRNQTHSQAQQSLTHHHAM